MKPSNIVLGVDIAAMVNAAAATMGRAPLKVAVVSGGSSREADVSRSSALQVSAALGAAGHAVHRIELDSAVLQRLQTLRPDVVFPALHGGGGEDGTFQGALEMLGLPYVGSGVKASALAMHKPLAKLVFANAGLPVVDGTNLVPGFYSEAQAGRLLEEFGPEVVVKPSNEGSALGVTFCRDGRELQAALGDACAITGELLLERRIVGKEVTVGVLEAADCIGALTPIGICTPANSWYDYAHRYTPGLSEHVIPATVGVDVLATLSDLAVRAHQALNCRHLSRADFIVTSEGQPYLLEINTLPGMTGTSLFPDGARHLGIDFKALMDHLIRSAVT